MKIRDIEDVLSKKFGKDFRSVINNPDVEITNLLTDSRNCFNPEGSLFFAINTPGGNDGHKYIKDLYSRGERNFVVENVVDDLPQDINLLVVPDTIAALSAIGKLHRGRAKEIVAITGSRGKTTLKEMLFQLLEPSQNISRSPRSYNSKIGVPLSLWQITDDTDIALIEAGISKAGEMQNLADIIEPDTVIFTNIGDAHANGFVSKEQKAKEKALLAKGKTVKTIITSADYGILNYGLSDIVGKRVIRWSTKLRDTELFIREKNGRIEYEGFGVEGIIEADLIKDYDLENVAGALSYMLYKNYIPEEIRERFKSLKRINTRLNVSEGINGCSVILDSYTSDLSSLQPAIDFMMRRKMPTQTPALIISDLHHEGENTEKTYKEIARTVRETGIKRFTGIGKTFINYKELFPEGSSFYEDTSTFLENFSASEFNDEIILLKGSPEFDFKKIHEQLEAKKHETVLEVNLDAMLRNYNYFRSKVPSTTGIITMVKASGYGAGSYEIAKTLQDAGAAYLAVAALDEGIDLRRNGIVMPIMVMNPRAANYRSLFNNRLEPVVFSMDMLQDLTGEAEKYGVGEYPVHIKLDTGMHRMGFTEEEIPRLISVLKRAEKIKVASVFSHLATADCLEMDEFTKLQLERFERMSNSIKEAFPYEIKRHILNSAGILRFPEYHYDLVRLGIGLYGANTLPPEIEQPLAVVSTLRSVIICIREIDGEETVGYGKKGKITQRSRIATIPIGYADGMNRKFGNGAIKVRINGHEVPTIGNICMDATMIDVTGIDCKEGDSVEIFGENMSVQALADTLGTIPYEILTSVSPRVKRVYFRE